MTLFVATHLQYHYDTSELDNYLHPLIRNASPEYSRRGHANPDLPPTESPSAGSKSPVIRPGDCAAPGPFNDAQTGADNHDVGRPKIGYRAPH